MVARDLVDAVVADLVQPGVPDVTDDRARVVQHDDREDARHPVPFRPQSGEAVDFVVRDRDRFADAFDRWARLPLEPRPEHAHRGVGGFPSCGLSPDPVDDHEQPAGDVDVEPVLVDLSLPTRVGLAGCPEHADHRHRATHFLFSDS